MRVLIVSPKAKTGGLESLRKGNQILQGALYVAAAARDADHQVKVVIADSKDLEQFIQKYEPQVIGFSCVSSTYIIARDMIRLTKESHPKIKTIIGGHHATFLYKDVIEESGVDYVCRGEGEEAFPALLAALERGEEHPRIPGIVFLHDNEYHNDDVIALLDDIEALPQIERDLVDEAFSFTPKIVS